MATASDEQVHHRHHEQQIQMPRASEHGDRKGRHYYTTNGLSADQSV